MSYHPEADLRERHPDWHIETSDALPFGVTGWLEPERKAVVLAAGLTEVERRSTLAHEITHIDLGHAGHQSTYVEALVEALAAARLFTRSAFEEARAHGTGLSRDVADRLDVDHAMVLTWVRLRQLVERE